ncbi:MAG TPA: hypothetical protein VFO48_00130 [Vicinamibacterales bacterium]|nr:hypothetical protein [Vicinamibacterales bacterium]
MHPSDALRDGIRRVNRAPVILVCVLLITLLTALPFSLFMRDALKAHLANSVVAEQVALGVNVQWWNEFTEQAGTLGQTFRPAIIGFAAVLDNLSAFADGESRPAPILWLGALYLLLWLFLSGGILDRYARGQPTRSHEFFTACGVFFVRFLRLAPFIALAYYILFAIVHPFLLEETYAELTRDVTVERTAFFIRLALYAAFGVLLVFVSVIFDYAKVRAVVEDRRSMIGAIVAGARFVRRNAGAVAALYALTGALFVALLILYALAASGGGSTGAGFWIGLVIAQLFLLGRLWIRLVFFASETALFQGRLAHVGYIATAPAVRREPPIVENAV